MKIEGALERCPEARAKLAMLDPIQPLQAPTLTYYPTPPIPLAPLSWLQDVPLLGQLLMSGGQQHAAERRWMMQVGH